MKRKISIIISIVLAFALACGQNLAFAAIPIEDIVSPNANCFNHVWGGAVALTGNDAGKHKLFCQNAGCESHIVEECYARFDYCGDYPDHDHIGCDVCGAGSFTVPHSFMLYQTLRYGVYEHRSECHNMHPEAGVGLICNGVRGQYDQCIINGMRVYRSYPSSGIGHLVTRCCDICNAENTVDRIVHAAGVTSQNCEYCQADGLYTVID